MIEDFQDYLAAVEERQHLEGVIERGRKEFSGYGLELFERGIRGKIARLEDAIAQWDTRSGYNLTTSDWSGRNNLQVFTCQVAGQYSANHFSEPSSVAVFSHCVVMDCDNVRMLQGPMSLYGSVQLKPLYLCASAPPDILGVRDMFANPNSRDRTDVRCFAPV
jgi:hypothetical protein